jgi:hypothetical protein
MAGMPHAFTLLLTESNSAEVTASPYGSDSSPLSRGPEPRDSFQGHSSGRQRARHRPFRSAWGNRCQPLMPPCGTLKSSK